MDSKKIWNRIKKALKTYVHSTYVVLSLLVIVICSYLIFVILELESQILAASTTFALLIITCFYLVSTSRIIRKSEIDRELKNIKEQLSDLYSPLKFHPTILQITPEEFNRLKERSYLASEKMQKLLNEYFKTMDEFGSYVDTKFGKMLNLEHDDPRFVDLKNRFDEQVNTDYEFLLDKMKKNGGEKDCED